MNEKPDRAKARTTPVDPAAEATRDAAPDRIGPSDSGQLPGGHAEGGSTGDQVAMNFDDDEVYSGTGRNERRGGTTHARGGDSGKLDKPVEELSRSNNPRERNF
ncbi:hypothetical protein GT347_09695 [Xylophilus rhododendri]|uniref:Uncharacterized protein n=1 Tax=Xylophilus rhododendri TaxID=2697032 RepID=A0A857J5E6_9BURK|nr:hypothetical protein [Xylophilus rhododendri]QHI98242.1 hypothetical protein GT347_09695 [Xylophilus rhododendri]